MNQLPRDVLLKRIRLLQDQYAERLATHDHSRLQRFAAAAERIRSQAAEDDIAFVNQHLCRVMVSMGLISSEPSRSAEPRPAPRDAPAPKVLSASSPAAIT